MTQNGNLGTSTLKDKKLTEDFVDKQRKIVGANIREERQKRGFTIEQFAEFIGLSSSHVGLIERGERSPSFQVIYSIADFFTLTPNDILLERNDKKRKLSEDIESPKKDKIEAIESLLKDLEEHELEYILQNLIQFRTFREKEKVEETSTDIKY